MLRTTAARAAAGAAAGILVPLVLAGCGDISDFPAASSSPGCGATCYARATAIIPTPVPVPTLDPALVAWRNGVHDRVAGLTKDMDAIDVCGGPSGDDRADCRTKITTLMTDAKSMRDAINPHAVPPDAITDAGKLSDALDLLMQGCSHDDQALASNQDFVQLPGDTTAQAMQQLVAIDDDLRTS
jgi:hypothetical protein